MESNISSTSGRFLAFTIFSSRWLQAPLYIGLIVAQAVYVYRFVVDLTHLTFSLQTLGEDQMMLTVLGLIDVVMISNLLVMVIIGGYETFVSRLRMEGHPDIPEWLNHVNANTMKIKLAMALIGISSIHLLKSFIDIDHMPEHHIKWHVIIHIAFLVSAIALAYTAKMAQDMAAGDEK